MPKEPLPKPSKSRGRIEIGAYDKIKLTSTQKVIVGILLLLPYLAVVIIIFIIGLPVLGSILLGIGIFSGLLILFLRWLDKAQF